MSDAFWIAFWPAFFSNVPAIISALITAGAGAYILIRQNRTDRNIELIHKATNSMKDQLVASTAKASYSEGKEDGREGVD